MKKNKTKNYVILSYVLAFLALLGYWVAEFFGITGTNGWAFQQKLYILIPVLTLWYGTWFLAVLLPVKYLKVMK